VLSGSGHPTPARSPEALGRRSVARSRSTSPRSSSPSARDERLEAYFVTTLTTALRPGELGGLTRDNVDLDVGRLTVSKSMKMERNRPRLGATKRATAPLRTIDPSTWVVTQLRARRARQAEGRLAIGSDWSAGWPGLVLCSELGQPAEPLRTSSAR